MASDPQSFTSPRKMAELAARAVGRIDRDGHRGVTRVSAEEIAAMAGVLVTLGLVPVQPGEKFPETLIITPKEVPNYGPTEN